MANEPDTPETNPLPPKLDLRKQGMLRPSPGGEQPAATPEPGAAASEATPAAPTAAGGSPAGPAIRIVTPAGGAGTIRIAKPAVPAATPTPAGPAEAAVAAKRQTSRIPLEQATAAAPAAPGAPKTIRIRPAVAPGKTAPLNVLDRLTDDAAAEKRKTSRIPLEAALGTEGTAPSAPAATPETPSPAPAPKTIRLKRPPEAGIGQAEAAPEAPAGEAAREAEASKGVMSKTARLEEPVTGPEEEGPSPTRRKTIRIKRPISSTPPIGATVPGAQAARMAIEAPRAEEEPHWAFCAVTGLSIFVMLVTLWMFTAQTFGPNVSLSRTSYGAPALDLPWPGKLPPLP